MRIRRFSIPHSVVLGLGAAAFLAMMPPVAAEPTAEPSVYPEGQIFPSMLISTATQGVPEDAEELWDVPFLGDPNGLVGALFHDVKRGDRLRVVVKENSLMEESRLEGVCPATAEDVLAHPKIKYRYEALSKVHQQRPLNISVETWVNGRSLGEETVTVDVHSINDCLFAVLTDEGDVEFDANWNFAAYVNENHPWVDEVLRAALDTGIVDSFDGYQSEDPEQVLLQIFSVWNVMQRRGIRYSNITTTATESDTVLSQHVRLFDQSVEAYQANCVDGSVLIAAVLRKIGLETFLVTVPGHMYLAVNLVPGDDETMIGIETTMMGANAATLGESRDTAGFSRASHEAFDNDASFETFEAAIDAATDDLDGNWDHFNDEAAIDYQLIDLAEARREGIMPLGYSE